MSHFRRFHAYCALLIVLNSVMQSGCQSLSHRFWKHGDKTKTSSDALSQTSAAAEQMRLARSLEKQRKTDEAMKIYAQVAAEHGSSHAYHRLAVLHDQRGEFDQSITAYHKALEKDPRNPELLCDVGYSYYLQKRWAESEHFLKSALAEAPQLPRARNNHGLLLARLGRVEEALHQFSLAGCREPEARVNLAFAMTLEENSKEARRQLELALNLDRNCQPARQLLAAIEGSETSEKIASASPASKAINSDDSVLPPLESPAPTRRTEPRNGTTANVSHTARADDRRRDGHVGGPQTVEPARRVAPDGSAEATAQEESRFRIPATVVSQSSITAEPTKPQVRWKSTVEPAVEPPRFQ